jgi:DNA-binding SARP family transcriptional activator
MSKDTLMDLHLYALGPFQIVVNGRKVPLEQCPSKKAVSLLKYLFFKRHDGGVLIDEALELLWPEMNPKSTRSNLRVALSMIRKVFKNQGNGSKAFHNLIREGENLRLSLGNSGWSDVDEFLNQVKLADYKEKKNLLSEALKHYEKMAELYRGDFLAEDLYADWSYMEREYLRDQYVASLMRMVDCHKRLENHSQAISTLYRVLKIDKYREDAYCQLMALCAATGRKGEMLRIYNLCKRAIEDDLNLELSSNTVDLYKRLANASNGHVRFDFMRLPLLK